MFVLWPDVCSNVLISPYPFKKNIFFSSDSVLDETMSAKGGWMRFVHV